MVDERLISRPVGKQIFVNHVALFAGMVKDFQDISDAGSHANSGSRISELIEPKISEMERLVECLKLSVQDCSDDDTLMALCELLFLVLSRLEVAGPASGDALRILAERVDAEIFGWNFSENPHKM